MESPGKTPRPVEPLAIRVFRITANEADTDEQPTAAASPIFIVREAVAAETEELKATGAAKAVFRYRDAEAATEIPGKHAPQLLDVVVFSTGTIGIVSGPVLTLHWASTSVPTEAVEFTSTLEVGAIVIGMLLYRLRQRR